MEKLNIAELLKDCPKGMELYSPIFGDVYLDEIRPYLAVVVRTSDKQEKEFLYDGRFGINGECMLFPSKENRDWSKFQRPFKDGDVLAYQCPDFTNPSIYIHKYSQKLNTAFYVALSGNGNFKVRGKYSKALYGNDSSVRFATEEEKEKLFKAIKDNGYRWNNKAKTLEKLPKFKVGDKVKRKDDNYTYIVTIAKLDGDYYDYVNEDGQCGVIHISTQDAWELVPIIPKFKVGDRVHNKNYKDYIYDILDITDKGYRAKEIDADYPIHILFGSQEDNYELVPKKYDINTLKPFDKVLIRYSSLSEWNTGIFSHTVKSNNKLYFIANTQYWEQCIPYEGNEYLLGTTDACSDYFKTW